MKISSRRLKLHRETLTHLETARIEALQGRSDVVCEYTLCDCQSLAALCTADTGCETIGRCDSLHAICC